MSISEEPLQPLTYQPTARRPIAELFRALARPAVQACLRLNVHPDTVSYMSLVAATGAAACFWTAQQSPWFLVGGAALCLIRLYLNMLDGMVALASGKASRQGEIVNELPDRFSDVLIFAGIAHSGLCEPLLGYWTAIAALLTAYVGTLSQAVGASRQFGGVMSKPWRMALLVAGALTTAILTTRSGEAVLFRGLTILDWTCILILAGCVQTIWLRLQRTWRELTRLER